MEKNSCLHDGLLISTSTCNDSNCSSTVSWNSFSWTGWQSNSCSWTIFRVTNNSGICAGTSRVCTFVSDGRFDVADGCSFRNSVDWDDISNRYSSFPSTEKILSGIGTFSSQEIFSVMLVSVGVSKINFEKWSAPSWVMNDRSNNTFNISLPFGVVEIAISGRGDSFGFRCSIDTTRFAFSLTYIKNDLQRITLPIDGYKYYIILNKLK